MHVGYGCTQKLKHSWLVGDRRSKYISTSPPLEEGEIDVD